MALPLLPAAVTTGTAAMVRSDQRCLPSPKKLNRLPLTEGISFTLQHFSYYII